MKKNENQGLEIDREKEINPIIQEAVKNNFYNLDKESFFIQKIMLPISQSRNKYSFSNKEADKQLLSDYFTTVGSELIPSIELLNEISFITEATNSDLKSEMFNNLNVIFSVKSLMWLINHASKNLSIALSWGMTKKINSNIYNMQEVLDNMHVIDNEEKKKLLLSELYLTKDKASYLLLEKYIPLEISHKKEVVENILIANTDTILLNRELVKEIFMKHVKFVNFGQIDKYIKNLSMNKMDFLLDILIEAKTETQEDVEQKKITTAIYQIIDKALYFKNDDLNNRVIQLKKEQPKLTGDDIYILMIKRFYSYLKKDEAQKFTDKLMTVAKQNGDFNKIKDMLFRDLKNYKIESINREINLDDKYFKIQIKQHFVRYLEEKLPLKNTMSKPKKI